MLAARRSCTNLLLCSDGTGIAGWRPPSGESVRALRGEAVTTGAPAGRDNSLGAVHLRQEGGKRVAAANLVAGSLHECEPVAVVDLLLWADLLGENLERDFAQSLAPQERVELLDPQLVGQSADALELGQKPLVPGDLLLEPLDKRPQPLDLAALLDNPAAQEPILSEYRLIDSVSPQRHRVPHGRDRRLGGGRKPSVPVRVAPR